MLPTHGHVSCRKCFSNEGKSSVNLGPWKLQNDPCHWGSSNPTFLVLGFSKGFTQADEFHKGKFEEVPFKGMRSRLGRILKAFGMLGDAIHIDEQFYNPENDIAFASLIRCSAARVDDKKSAEKGFDVYGCTGSIIPKSFKEIPQVISNCAGEFLLGLPRSVKTVVLLGNSDSYVKHTKELIKHLFEPSFEDINPCAVAANGKLWVWAGHPSGLNGHFEKWIQGTGKSGQKFRYAISAIKGSMK